MNSHEPPQAKKNLYGSCRRKQLIFYKVVGLMILVLVAGISYSQQTTFLPLTKLETKDGLSSPNVRKIVQDKYGFMWFATQDGLNRFDGSRFVRYISASPDPSHVILESDVYDLGFDESGDHLWCLTAYGGLSKINVGTGIVVATFPIATHPVSKNKLWFKSMSIRNGSAYIGSDEGLVIKFNLSTYKTENVFNANDAYHIKNQIDKIFVDKYGYCWLMITENGIRITDTAFTKHPAFFSKLDMGIAPASYCQFTGFCEINGELLITSTAGLINAGIKDQSLIKNNKSRYHFPDKVSRNILHCISASDQYIFLSGSSGLFKFNKATKEIDHLVFSKNHDDNKWLTLTYSIYQTGESIWIGSQYGVGWIKNIAPLFTGFYHSTNGNGVKIEHSITLCNANDSVVVACADDGLYFTNHITGTINKFSVHDFFYHAFKGPSGYIIASALNKGLHVADQEGKAISLTTVFPELTTIKNDLLISSESLDDSVCFMASQYQNGVYIWNYRKKTVRILSTSSNPALRSNVINRLFLDSQKRLWIVGDNTVSIFTPRTNQITHLDLINPRTKQPFNINMDICEAGGRFWMATYGTGIVEFTDKGVLNQIFSAKEKINNLGLYKIFKLNDSLLITSSNNGLSVLNINSKKIINYFEESGLQSNNFEETSGCSNAKYIFLGGIRGFTKIDREKFSIQNENKRLFFSSIQIHEPTKISETADLSLKKISIPSNSVQVIINFSSLNFSAPEKNIFRYRIKELSENWNSLENQNFVSLSPLPPGPYHLEVSAANETEVWSNPIELDLNFLPKWYQTWLFRILVALAMASIFYGLYRFRINQLKKEEKIRKQVAGDLHDELGSTLNSVKIFANLALLEKENTTHLEKIKESTQSAISGVKDIIWVLDDKRDTLDHLLGRIDQFARPICEAAGISYKQQSGGNESYKLGKEEKRNLYMIIKESINNSIKYADCSVIELLIKNNGGKLNISISDNGKGFDKDKIESGYGLRNIMHRSKEIEYHAEINSSPGNGTLIYLEKK